MTTERAELAAYLRRMAFEASGVKHNTEHPFCRAATLLQEPHNVGVINDIKATVTALQGEEDAGWSPAAHQHLLRLATSVNMLVADLPAPEGKCLNARWCAKTDAGGTYHDCCYPDCIEKQDDILTLADNMVTEAMVGVAKMKGWDRVVVNINGKAKAALRHALILRDAKMAAFNAMRDALKTAKRDLMHQRRFGVDRLNEWRNVASSVEGDIEEALAAAKEMGEQAQGECNLPERDASKPAEAQGLFRKFNVTRTDGSDKPGGKHHGCEYFVLDVEHDPHAKAALQAYALACAATHPQLSADLIERHGVQARKTCEECHGTGFGGDVTSDGVFQDTCWCCNGTGYEPLHAKPQAQVAHGVCGEIRGACGLPCEPCEGKPDPEWVTQQPQAQGEAERFNCPECRHSFNVADELERPRLECPVCGHEPINENLNHPNPAHPQASEPAENPWKDAVLEQLVAHAMDAPVDMSPAKILQQVIDMAISMATDPVVTGWKLVPVEPTPEMALAFAEVFDVRQQRETFHAATKAMLAAAPEATTPEPVGINGLTESETSASMSVMGLSKK